MYLLLSIFSGIGCSTKWLACIIRILLFRVRRVWALNKMVILVAIFSSAKLLRGNILHCLPSSAEQPRVFPLIMIVVNSCLLGTQIIRVWPTHAALDRAQVAWCRLMPSTRSRRRLIYDIHILGRWGCLCTIDWCRMLNCGCHYVIRNLWLLVVQLGLKLALHSQNALEEGPRWASTGRGTIHSFLTRVLARLLYLLITYWSGLLRFHHNLLLWIIWAH